MTLGEGFNWWADASTAGGLLITVVGAWIAARAVILSDDEAVHIGVARFPSGEKEQDLKLPSVQNLLSSSRAARNGLYAVAFGSVLQLWPVAVRVIAPYC